jgi:hypothetical protein
MGATPPPSLKHDELSADLQTSVWNLCLPWLFPPVSDEEDRARYMRLMSPLYREMHWPIHQIPWHSSDARKLVADHVLGPSISYTRFYQFAEFIPVLHALTADPQRASSTDRERLYETARVALNDVLEQEGSPYRMAVNELVPITSEEELAAVRKASSTPAPFELAGEHIDEALAHLARRPDPNYHDCITQAFKAVESVLWVAIDDKPKIPEAIRRFQEKFGPMHGAVGQLIEKLHGYASDEEGVRHAATEATVVGEAEARLMLVSCSAMMNFLIRKALKV